MAQRQRLAAMLAVLGLVVTACSSGATPTPAAPSAAASAAASRNVSASSSCTIASSAGSSFPCS